jgi:galactokinase
MKKIANYFGEQVLRPIDQENFVKRIPELTNLLGDRAILRALHFFKEDDRVVRMVNHLKQNNLLAYLKTAQESGDSSYKFLQNIFTCKHVADQKISLAIALTEHFDNFQGAVRVHGGGFAGTVQIYLKLEKYEEYKKYMEHYFGPQSVTPLIIRQSGALTVF